jgi:riboflavin synthase
MFTGIVQGIGSVVSISAINGGLVLVIDLNDLDPERIRPGDSIAVNGACLTANRIKNRDVYFDVSGETLSKCLIGDWVASDRVNLELALTLQTPIGGHLVSGHIDGAVKLVHIRNDREYTAMQFEVGRDIGKFIAVKGSVAIDGVSLTTNTVTDEDETTFFEVMLVPHTLKNTTLGILEAGSLAHIEVDQIARYIQRICSTPPDTERL